MHQPCQLSVFRHGNCIRSAQIFLCDFFFFLLLNTFSIGGTLLVAQLVEALRYKSEGRWYDS
jgi:hypothetical protein